MNNAASLTLESSSKNIDKELRTGIDSLRVQIHIKESLEPDERSKLENFLKRQVGIVDPRFDPNEPHRMLITYEAGYLDILDIVHYLRYAGATAAQIGII